MSRLVVIAEPEIALGYKLTGIEVIETSDLETARVELQNLMNDPGVGFIAVSPAIIDGLDDATRRRVESGYSPIVVSLPAGGSVMGFRSHREYLTSLIRRAVGLHITFPGAKKEGNANSS